MIILRLYDVESSIGTIDLLNHNKYNYIHSYGSDIEMIKKDIIELFKYPSPFKNGYNIYYIEIDEENKTFGLHSKWVDKAYMRAEKLKNIL